jgi:RNA polymerase sigma-70 factor (ECF subfamily)
LDIIRNDFEETTLKAFWGMAVDGRSSADVASDLGLSKEAVRRAKFRVLKRLREELAGML